MKEKLVIIGNGMAAANMMEHLLKINPGRYELTVFGAEPHPNYNRILLSSVLAGDSQLDDIILNSYEWYEKNGIRLHTGETVTKIDPVTMTVKTANGMSAAYGRLVIATGSRPFILPLPGADKEGVIAFRSIEDCEAMRRAARSYKKAVVIGGGLLGLEAARGLLNLGMEVDVVHLSDRLMERQLDGPASKLLQAELERQGMRFLLQKTSAAILGGARVEGLEFQDGSRVAADLIVMAVGIRPNVELARTAGIAVERGIVVDDVMATNVGGIYAVGECAQHRGVVYGLVAPLYEQGAVLAKHLAGADTKPYEGSLVYTKLKVSGVHVFSGGQFLEDAETKAIRVEDEWSGQYKKVLVKDSRIVGAVLFGDTSDSARLTQLIRSRTDISAFDKSAILPEGGGTGGRSAVEAMGEDEIVCGCNGVSKGAILSAIRAQGLCTVEEVKNCTNASRSCGGCKSLIKELLASTLGDGFDGQAEKETVCGCTELNAEELVAAIKAKGLTGVREVMHVLEWKTAEGCPKCRPALNYYLTMLYPGAYRDDRASRFVNERLHGNIQKDGTFSVVPRIYGGVTTPKDLRRIAEVAEKYRVPTVKLTGGQRIDLLGVKKEDLPGIWAELDMPSGYAYAKAVRTVKTCVGSDYCRFGTADSMGMGIRMEKHFERLDTPAKIKMAVSGCPRNCAESGIKDLGVVAVDGGWELYAGGNGGVDIRAGDKLAVVADEDEVIAYAEAYLQYYRETAHYGERTSKWVERLGIEQVRSVIADEARRGELCARIRLALSATTDPWKRAVENRGNERAMYRVLEPSVVNGEGGLTP